MGRLMIIFRTMNQEALSANIVTSTTAGRAAMTDLDALVTMIRSHKQLQNQLFKVYKLTSSLMKPSVSVD